MQLQITLCDKLNYIELHYSFEMRHKCLMFNLFKLIRAYTCLHTQHLYIFSKYYLLSSFSIFSSLKDL